jgi:hypothetical protein
MRERAQASVETIALTAAIVALAGALATGLVRFGPPLAASLARAIAGEVAPAAATSPRLDDLERLLVASATSPDADGATLLDLRARLRTRLGRTAGDAAFAATIRPLVARTLAAQAIDGTPGEIRVVGRSAEDSWLRDHFHPGVLGRFKQFAVSVAGRPGAVAALFHHGGLGSGELDGIEPGHAAGDIVVDVGDNLREVVLRRRADTGLTIIAERGRLSVTGGGQR